MTKKQFIDLLPKELLTRLSLQFGWDIVDSITDAWFSEKATTFRRNPIKCSAEALATRMGELGVTAESISGVPDAFRLMSPDSSSFFRTSLVSDGWVYVQSVSSMLPAIVVDPHKGECILDLCAAPGSKTTQMASMIGNDGQIIASDLSRVRIYKLEANLGTQGVTCVTSVCAAGESMWQTYPEYFDRVLVDVPCSMEGTFEESHPASWEQWTPKKPKWLGSKQRWLLRSAISAAKIGATIVYSTCTLSPDENEDVVEWILKKESQHIQLSCIEFPKEIPAIDAMTAWKGKPYQSDMSRCRRILPSPLYEGFFIAKFTKVASSVSTHYLK